MAGNFVRWVYLEGLPFDLELAGDVGAVDACLEALHVTANISFAGKQVALVHLFLHALAFVGADNVHSECLHHQQHLQGVVP